MIPPAASRQHTLPPTRAITRASEDSYDRTWLHVWCCSWCADSVTVHDSAAGDLWERLHENG